MCVREAALLGLEEAINAVVALDGKAARRLAAFHDRVIGIEVTGLGLRWFFVPDAVGRLQVLTSVEDEPDCQMRAAPLDLVRSALAKRKEDALFAGRLEIRGDTDLAHRFSEILADLDIDWEEQLSRLTGDIPAHEAGKAARSAGRWAGRTGRIAERDLREYLQEEARLLPASCEAEEWQDEVDRLRDDAERLAVRIARLEAPPGDRGEGA